MRITSWLTTWTVIGAILPAAADISSPDLWRARTLLDAGQVAHALRLAQRATSAISDPDESAVASGIIARAASQTGDCRTAMIHVRKALVRPEAHGKDRALVYFSQARCLRRQGQLAKAAGQALSLLGTLTQEPLGEAYGILAEHAIAQGRAARGTQALDRAWRYGAARHRPWLQKLAERLGADATIGQLKGAHASIFAHRFPAGHLAVRLAEKLTALGQVVEAKDYLEKSKPALTGDKALEAKVAALRAGWSGKPSVATVKKPAPSRSLPAPLPAGDWPFPPDDLPAPPPVVAKTPGAPPPSVPPPASPTMPTPAPPPPVTPAPPPPVQPVPSPVSPPVQPRQPVATPQPKPQPKPPTSSVSAADAARLARVIQKTAPNTWSVDGAFARSALGGNESLAECSSIYQDGGGYRIECVEAGGLFDRMGLRNGDIILEVNGYSLTNAISAFFAYTMLQNASQLTARIRRGSQVLVHRYVFR